MWISNRYDVEVRAAIICPKFSAHLVSIDIGSIANESLFLCESAYSGDIQDPRDEALGYPVK